MHYGHIVDGEDMIDEVLIYSAIFLVVSVLADIKSITDSASIKSIRPFKKARFVNSPGAAGRQLLQI